MSAQDVDLASLRIRKEPLPPIGSKRKIPWTILLMVIMILAIGIGLWAWKPWQAQVQEVNLVTATKSAEGEASGVLIASGYIVPQRKAAVASKATGRLTFLGIEEGDHVKEGQILARLEDDDVKARLNQSIANRERVKAQIDQEQSNVDKVTQEFKRIETLTKSKLISASEWDIKNSEYKSGLARLAAAKADLNLAEANIASAQVDIENTIIRAPFGGTVLTKNADLGEMVSPVASSTNSRAAVATIADMTSLQLEADVSEAYIERVKVDQQTNLVLDAYPEKTYLGSVWKIVPTANRAKGTVVVKIKFLELDSKVLPEMSAKVTFLSDNANHQANKKVSRISVPSSSVLDKDGKKWVFAVREGIVQQKAIEIGQKLGNQIEIIQGLSGGESIVDQPTKVLQTGDRVKPKKAS